MKYAVCLSQRIFSLILRSKITLLLFVILIFFSLSCDNPVNYKPPIIPIVYPEIDSYPSWSPDGLKILYTHHGITEISRGGVFHINHDSAGLWIMDADGSNQRLLIKGFLMYGAWSPDGKWIVFERGGQIYKVPFVGDSVDGSRIQQLTFQGENFFPAWSPDGKWIAYDSNSESPNGMNFIWLMRPDGSEKRRITYEPSQGEIRMPHWSPGGNKIVHIRYLVGTFSSEIFIMDSNGTNPNRLTFNNATDRHPRYSPDGTKIVFQSQAVGVPQIWLMNADGTGLKQLTTEGGFYPSWSPDGRKIVFIGWTNNSFNSYNPRQNGTVWVMNADGSNKRQLTYGPN